MLVLTILTLIYLGVLVLALAASLMAILLFLWRVGSTLAEVREALAAARDATAALPGHLERVRWRLSPGPQ